MAKRSKDEIECVAKRAFLSEGAAETLTDAVRQALKRDVLTAALAPGLRLSVRTLSERYGVGATPVREALWSLVGDGLIVAEAQHGFQVAGAERSRLASLLLLRRRVEPWLLSVALRNGGADWLQGVERAFAAFQPVDAQVGDLRPLNEEWERLHQGFHLSLIAGSGMPVMLDLARRWYNEIDRYRRIDAGALTVEAGALSVEAGAKPDHEALFELVTGGAAADAVTMLTRHIEDTAARHRVHFDDEDHELEGMVVF